MCGFEIFPKNFPSKTCWDTLYNLEFKNPILNVVQFSDKLSTQTITTLQQCRDAITAIVDDVRAHPEMVINVFKTLRVSFVSNFCPILFNVFNFVQSVNLSYLFTFDFPEKLSIFSFGWKTRENLWFWTF